MGHRYGTCPNLSRGKRRVTSLSVVVVGHVVGAVCAWVGWRSVTRLMTRSLLRAIRGDICYKLVLSSKVDAMS
jgi:hypothetical protein